MLICRAPVKAATISLNCCPGRETRSAYAGIRASGDRAKCAVTRARAKRESGLTVGDLLDATQKRRDDHRLCPHAGPALLDDDGVVMVDVKFILVEPEVEGKQSHQKESAVTLDTLLDDCQKLFSSKADVPTNVFERKVLERKSKNVMLLRYTHAKQTGKSDQSMSDDLVLT